MRFPHRGSRCGVIVLILEDDGDAHCTASGYQGQGEVDLLFCFAMRYSVDDGVGYFESCQLC